MASLVLVTRLIRLFTLMFLNPWVPKTYNPRFGIFTDTDQLERNLILILKRCVTAPSSYVEMFMLFITVYIYIYAFMLVNSCVAHMYCI